MAMQKKAIRRKISLRKWSPYPYSVYPGSCTCLLWQLTENVESTRNIDETLANERQNTELLSWVINISKVVIYESIFKYTFCRA